MRSSTPSHHWHGWATVPLVLVGIVLVLVGLAEHL